MLIPEKLGDYLNMSGLVFSRSQSNNSLKLAIKMREIIKSDFIANLGYALIIVQK